MKKHFLRICSLILCVALLIGSLPMDVFSETLQNKPADPNDEPNTQETGIAEEAYIVGELTEERTEYSKEFRMSNGNTLAVVYSNQVHYQEDNKWKEIDNTLQLSGNNYTNTAGLLQVTLPKSLSATAPMTVTRNGHTLSITMAGQLRDENSSLLPAKTAQAEQTGTNNRRAAEATQQPVMKKVTIPTRGQNKTFRLSPIRTAAGQVKKFDLTEERKNAKYEQTVLEKPVSAMRYSGIYNSTDVQYDLQGNRVKESVILNSYDSGLRGYQYALNTGKLEPVLAEDGSVSLYDEKENLVLYMDAPFLVDDAQVYNYDIHVSLSGENGSYILTYLLPQQWLAEESRAWPVVLDPTVTNSPNIINIRDHTVASNVAHDDIEKDVLECGYGNINGIQRFFIKYNDLPALQASEQVVYAQMRLYKKGISDCTVTVDVHKVLGSWESETINWNNKPNYSSIVEDYALVDGEGFYTWNVTDIVRDWYANENNGMMFKASDTYETGTTPTWKQFCSSDCGAAYYLPSLSIMYRHNNGIEGYYTYQSMSAGNAGTAYICDSTGQLKVENNIGSYNSSINPFSLNLVYNSDYFAQNGNASDTIQSTHGLDMYFGSGFTWNVVQTVKQANLTNADAPYLVYHDGDGTAHYFQKQTDGKYYDEDGLGLTITPTSSGYTMKDTQGNNWLFSGSLLSEMSDETGNRIIIDWGNDGDGKYIRKIQQENKNGNKITIATVTYISGTSKVSKLTDGTGRVYTFGYSNDRLITIHLDGDQIAKYDYAGNRLVGMKDMVSGYQLWFTYAGGKVDTFQEWSNSTSGACVKATYQEDMTTYRDYGLDRQANTDDDILTSYSFDFTGKTINAVSCDATGKVLGASNAVYEDSGNLRKTNHTKVAASIGMAAQNLLKASGFESNTGTSAWTMTQAGTGQTSSFATSLKRTGVRSLEMKMQNGTGAMRAEQAVYLTEGKNYTLSGYVNTYWVDRFATGGSVYLRLVGNGAAENSTAYADIAQTENGWVRLSVTLTAPVTSYYSAAIWASDFEGWIYVDDLQLEEAEAPSDRNIVENGNLSLGNYAWQFQDGAAYGTGSNAGTLSLPGDPTKPVSAWQNVTVNKPKSQTYVLSGWAKANAVPEDSDTTDKVKSFGLRATVYYTSGEHENFYIPFCPDVDDWQFTSLTIVPNPKQSESTTVSYIQVVCAYEKNSNSALFKDISLVCQTAQTMKYDDEGNLVKVTTTGQSDQTANYDSNGNLISLCTGGTGTFEYTYDTTYTHRVLTSTDGVLKQTYTYDGKGNVSGTTLAGKNNEGTLSSSSVYSTDGNRVAKETDANGNSVQYAYSELRNMGMGLPSSVTDASGVTTYYGYDNFGRTVAANRKTTDNGVAVSNSVLYNYLNGNLTYITRERDGQHYKFDYDKWGNNTQISVGENVLASYTYGNGSTNHKNNPLTAMEYGNGSTVDYTYDALGRIATAVYKTGSETSRTLTYTYNGNGQLYSVHDSQTEETCIYNYDDLGRLISSREGSMSTEYRFNTDAQSTYSGYNDQKLGRAYETYTYDTTTDNAISDGKVTAMRMYSGDTVAYTYNALQQLTYKHIADNRTGGGFWECYSYSGTQVATKRNWKNDTTEVHNFSYTYDSLGNILTEAERHSGTTVDYTYDQLGQLTSADHKNGITERYTYDNAGNLLTFNNGYGISHNYTYGDDQWKDLLTVVDTTPITYDAIGNPLSYYNGYNYSMAWAEGRRLQEITYHVGGGNANRTTKYSYNSDGLRIKKLNANGTYVEYHIADGRYVGETHHTAAGNSDRYIRYIYDESGSVCGIGLWNAGVSSQWEDYYFLKNLQGDVLQVYRESDNTLAAQYSYDSWGNIVSATGTLTFDGVAVKDLNPFRYRSYYFDSETWFYYLQSRYYDPSIGRFINADGLVSTGQGILGNNMFAYCLNNPITFLDSKGSYATKYYDNPAAEVGAIIGGLIAEIISTNEEEKNANGKHTTKAKIKRTFKSFFSSIEASAGIGLGMYGGTEALDISLSGGIYYNLVNLELRDGKLKLNKTYETGVSATVGPFGYGSIEGGQGTSHPAEEPYNYNGLFYDKGAFFGAGAYLFAGANFSIGFDIEQFIDELSIHFNNARK